MTSRPETSYRVRGGGPLYGTVFIQGAKNAALKMIAASLLTCTTCAPASPWCWRA